jgi:hypothetical protein
MPLLLPNLDDRTWADLVAEATALIPVYGPEWTDQNYSDPGITLVELCAWIAEMDIYQLNQVSDQERLKFLILVGVAPRPPAAAHAVLSLLLKNGVAPISLPATLEFAGTDPFAVSTRYRTVLPVTLAQGSLAALQYEDSLGYHDLTPQWLRGSALLPFGAGPLPGTAFYLALTAALPVDQPVQLYFQFGDGKSGFEERTRLRCELLESQARCNRPPKNDCQEKSTKTFPDNPVTATIAVPLTHYGVRTIWQYLATDGEESSWVSLDPKQNQVVDNTRAFTLDGAVTLCIPGAMGKESLGAVAAESYYVRCVFAAGAYDATPSIQEVAFNAVVAEQAVPLVSMFTIAANASISYAPSGPPAPNTLSPVKLALDTQGSIVKLDFNAGSPTDPNFLVLQFKAPTAVSSGALCLEAAVLGFGNGLPYQQVALRASPVLEASLRLYTLEDGAWHAWTLRSDFYASQRTDHDAVLDPTTGILIFGNGEKGRVPPPGCTIFASALTSRAQAGNLAAGAIQSLADTPHNHALLYDSSSGTDHWAVLNGQLASLENPLAAWGGAAAETIDQAAGRADLLVTSSGRAVTLKDYEQLAAATPGTRIARVTALANRHPDFPCFQAPGMVTVIVLPYLPQGSPMPTPGLLSAVAAYLSPRRVIGTRVEVTGPTYLDVAVQATVQAVTGTTKTGLQQKIISALNTFFDPLIGGPDGDGWPFGRFVYRAEVMKIIDSVAGVNYIASLDLLADGGQKQCGNICLGATWLVKAGTHQITVN